MVTILFIHKYIPLWIHRVLALTINLVPDLHIVREPSDWNHQPWPGMRVTTCKSYLTAGGLGKEHRNNKMPTTGIIQERPVGERRRQPISPTNLPASSLEPFLAGWCMHHKEEPEPQWLIRDNLDTNPITVIPKMVSHVAEQFSWLSSPCCSWPGHSFPVKSLALSVHVSPQIIHFLGLDKSPFQVPEGVPLPATRWGNQSLGLRQLKR